MTEQTTATPSPDSGGQEQSPTTEQAQATQAPQEGQQAPQQPQETLLGGDSTDTPVEGQNEQQEAAQSQEQQTDSTSEGADGAETEGQETPKLTAADYKVPDFVPEGMKGPLSQFAEKVGYTQEQFEATVTTFGSLIHGMEQQRAQQLQAQAQEVLTSWGQDANRNLGLAKRALDFIDSSGTLKQHLNTTGAGNDPVVLKTLYEFGKRLQEGGYLKTEKPAQKPKDVAHRLYPDYAPQEAA